MLENYNEIRRFNLYRYTFLGMISYQIPVGLAYLAKYFAVATYEYADISYGYMAFVLCSLSALAMIKMRKRITNQFSYFILHYQVWIFIFISAYLVHALQDFRSLVPIGSLLILFFVFIQSSLLVSMIVTVISVVFYLAATYISINISGHPGVFIKEVLYIMVFLPVCSFLAYMASVIQAQQRKIKIGKAHLTSAHNELGVTHERLESAHNELATQNQRMIDSIQYAEMIQRSLLPGIERIKTVSPDSMFIWIPKDIVGGDIFYTYSDDPISLIALADCTGHGVPGAFLTIIVYAELRRIIKEEGCRQPSEILKRLNAGVKNALHKENRVGGSNDGLDAGVCLIDHGQKKVHYAGGRMPLFYITGQDVCVIQGDKQSLGYRNSDVTFDFTEHVIDVAEQGFCYLKSDGFTDQIGGHKNLRFGTVRFKRLILEHHRKDFGKQRKIFLETLTEYKGDHEQKDDITLIGFKI